MNFSIVTISYNQKEFLDECLNSVLPQLGKDDEYIIVDPGSTDGSRELIESTNHPNVKRIFEQDLGPADGLNKGFSIATGDIYFYLNSDDVLLPGALNKVRKQFEKGAADILIGDGFIIDKESRIIKPVFSEIHFSCYRYLVGASVALQQATFFKASAFKYVGGFNVENKTCWDGELLLDFSSRGFKIEHYDSFLGAFRIYDQSITGSQRLRQAYDADKRRMFQEKLGRSARRSDKLFGALFRTQSFLHRKLRHFTRRK